LPVGLKMAEVGGWRSPFFAVAGLGAIITLAALWLLPPLRAHLDVHHETSSLSRLRELVSRREVVLAYMLTVLIMIGHFAVIPNLSAYLQHNLGYPRDQLSWLYFAGGLASFAVMRGAGRLVDHFGAARVAVVGVAMVFAVMEAWFLTYAAWLGVLGLFVAYMAATSVRGVAYQTLTMKVPFAHERAGYMSVQSAVAHASAGAGAMLSSVILSPRPDGGLLGMERVALFAMATCLIMPAFFYKIEAALARRGPAAAGAEAALPPLEL
jgi:predicted MFS family arabinose efflux permease